MDAERILGALIEGALTGRRGRQRALRRLTGGSGSLISAHGLLSAAGLAWGLYEAATVGSGTARGVPPPPLPRSAEGGGPWDAANAHPELVRIVRLTVSAARADGDLSLEERGRILTKAREVGAESLVTGELQNPRPLVEIVSGVEEPRLKRELYGLAYGIVRTDAGVSGAERIYLAQLAHLLGLDPATTTQIEGEIDAAPVEGVPR